MSGDGASAQAGKNASGTFPKIELHVHRALCDAGTKDALQEIGAAVDWAGIDA